MTADGQIALQFALRDTPQGATPVASASLLFLAKIENPKGK